MTHPTPSTPPDGASPRKSILHCPTCGHESPADGDWRVAREARETEPGRKPLTYTCPECETVVTTRSGRRAMIA